MLCGNHNHNHKQDPNAVNSCVAPSPIQQHNPQHAKAAAAEQRYRVSNVLRATDKNETEIMLDEI